MCPSEADLICYSDGTLDVAKRGLIDQHLDGCSVCFSLCAELMRSSAVGDRAESPIDRTPLFAAGTEVGGKRYRLRRAVGAGAMGQVYEADDLLLDRRVALKTLGPLLASDPNAARRLRSEVALAHRVTHPNVCRLYDIGFEVLPGSAGPVPFITMEFLEGPTLAAHARAGGLASIRDATAVLIQVASGLAAAHEVGVIHRDLKADNVMLVRDNSGRMRAVMTDFGLARQMDASNVDEQTKPSLVYSAPEQLRGRAATAASDVYAFGVMACELLAGPAGRGAKTVAALRKQFDENSRADGIPAALRAWILRAVEDDPVRRLADGQSLLNAGQRACKLAFGPTAARRRVATAMMVGALGTGVLVVGLANRQTGGPRFELGAKMPSNPQVAPNPTWQALAPASETTSPSVAGRAVAGLGVAGRQRRPRNRRPEVETVKSDPEQPALVEAAPGQRSGDIVRELRFSDRRSHADLVGLSVDRSLDSKDAR